MENDNFEYAQFVELMKAEELHSNIRDTVNKMDECVFMSFIGLVMDDWEAQNNGDTVDMLERLTKVSRDVHKMLGRLPRRAH